MLSRCLQRVAHQTVIYVVVDVTEICDVDEDVRLDLMRVDDVVWDLLILDQARLSSNSFISLGSTRLIYDNSHL